MGSLLPSARQLLGEVARVSDVWWRIQPDSYRTVVEGLVGMPDRRHIYEKDLIEFFGDRLDQQALGTLLMVYRCYRPSCPEPEISGG